MPRNVELKARVAAPDFDRVVGAAAQLSGTPGGELIVQRDVFFETPDRGRRLKLRRLETGAELIAYVRADAAGPKLSEYEIARTHDADGLERALALALGVRGIVSKRRTLFLVGRTRVHCDVVDDLGHFVELEVVLRDGESTEEGERDAVALMRQLGIPEDARIRGAYLDLLK